MKQENKPENYFAISDDDIANLLNTPLVIPDDNIDAILAKYRKTECSDSLDNKNESMEDISIAYKAAKDAEFTEQDQNLPEPNLPLEMLDGNFYSPKKSVSDKQPPFYPPITESTAQIKIQTKNEAESFENTMGKQKKDHKALRTVGNVLFYGILFTVLITGLLYGVAGSKSRNRFGFSILRVLSGSMESEIPKGSLVFCLKTDMNKIKIDDDITFLMDKDTTVTHRVIKIYENYEGRGMRGFETKGIENNYPDDEIVMADNVLGKVVWHIAGVDSALNFLYEKWLIILIPILGLSGLGITLKILFSKDKTQPAKNVTRIQNRKEEF